MLAPRFESALRPLPGSNGLSQRPLQRLESATLLPTVASPQPLTVINLLRCLKRRWKRAVSLGIALALCLGAAVWLFLPPSKPSASVKIYFPTMPERTAFDHPDAPIREMTQREVVRSQVVLRRVLNRPEIAELETMRSKPNPVGWLMREMTADFPLGSEIMTLTIFGDLPDDLRKIIVAVEDDYLEYLREYTTSQRHLRLKQLNEAITKAEKELDKIRAGLIKAGMIDIGSVAESRRLTQEEIRMLKAELDVIQSNIERLKRDEDRLNRRMTSKLDHDEIMASSEFLRDPEVIEMNKRKLYYQRELSKLRSSVGENNPVLKQCEEALKEVETQIAQRAQELESTIGLGVRRQLEKDLEKVRDELLNEQSRETKKKSLLTSQKQEQSSSGEQEASNGYIEWSNKSKELQELKDTRTKLEVERNAPPRGRPLDEPSVVIPNETMRRTRFAGIAMVLSFSFVLVFSAFREYRNHRIGGQEDLLSLGLPLIGSLPGLARGDLSEISGPDGEKGLAAVDALRTVFLHASGVATRAIACTIPTADDGRSLLASRLARSLARSGRKVLLVDGRLRDASLHREFSLPVQPGLCECLRGEASAAKSTQMTNVPNLWVLPAGLCDQHALLHLGQEDLSRVVGELKAGFDFVLFDAEPVLAGAEGLLLCQHADAVLLSVIFDQSQAESISSASHRLNAIGARLLGVVAQESSNAPLATDAASLQS